jgi:hypothetical protein
MEQLLVEVVTVVAVVLFHLLVVAVAVAGMQYM